ncbi:MAG TPA: tetratricopeptide repeat protein [Methylococcaceae bacterium]|nr:tetratricopeptide repeat protein [Methylococcaceae bacterium]
MQELIYLLLPAAAASGWYAASRYHAKNSSAFRRTSSSPDTLRSIGHWLKMRPERSSETIAKVLDSEREPYTTHMALAALYRKEGEMEKAIGLHQRLLARESLSADERGKVLFELGLDYHRAGLFDRAEEVFLGLVESPFQRVHALSQLLDIYQHEKDWRKAIPCLQELRRLGKVRRRETVAQLLCELAQESRSAARLDEAESFARDALRDDGACARATLLLAEIEIARGNPPAALAFLEGVERRTPETVAEMVRILSAHLDTWPEAEVNACVERIRASVEGIPEIATLQALLLARQQGLAEARRYLSDEAERNPSFQTLHTLAALMRENSTDSTVWRIMEQGLGRFAALNPRYRCTQCGVAAEQLHWRCPACRHWETLRLAMGAGA